MSSNHPEDMRDGPPRSTALTHLRALESVRAPDSLHRAIERMASEAATDSRKRRLPAARASASGGARGWGSLRLRLVGAGALLAATAAIVVAVLGSGGQPAPTVLDASRVALAAPTLPSPVENPHDPGKLDAAVEGLAYPYWGGRRDWPAVGARNDRLSGRSVTTVFYAAHSGARIGYAIVAGPPLAEPSASTVLMQGGVRFRVLSADGATVVTWRETGHTCILAARGVPARAMVRLVLS